MIAVNRSRSFFSTASKSRQSTLNLRSLVQSSRSHWLKWRRASAGISAGSSNLSPRCRRQRCRAAEERRRNGVSRALGKRSRTVFAWFAVGDIAISPFVAVGGVAVGPIAIGAITAGVLSLSVFWGVAVGVLAVGSLAFGWWALGCAAAGVKCAVGFAAVARDYALGCRKRCPDRRSRGRKEAVNPQTHSRNRNTS
jgi:hypothetical protein